MIHLFLAAGFEEIEALGTLDIIRRCGIEIITVSITNEHSVEGAHHICVNADMAWNELNVDDVEHIILPGGMPGAENLRSKSKLVDLLISINNKGGLIAAICAAPFVLGTNHLLKGKQATCYPGFEDLLLEANVTGKLVEEDHNIITAKGPGATFAFASTIAKRFVDSKIVDDVMDGMIVNPNLI